MTDTFVYTRIAKLDSSAIDLAAYDDNSGDLLIRFVEGGNDYVYPSLPAGEYEDLLSARSAGRWYRDEIQGFYHSIKKDGHVNLEEKLPEGTPTVNPAKDRYGDGQDMYLAGESNYTVKWRSNGIGGEPSYKARTEEHALSQFRSAIEELGLDDYTIVSVTHYLG